MSVSNFPFVVILTTSFFILVASLPDPTLEEIFSEMSKDHKMVNFTNKLYHISVLTAEVDKTFEIELLHHSSTEQKATLEKAKAAHKLTKEVLLELNLEIGQTTSRQFFQRMFLETLRLETASYGKLLKWISLETLGLLSGEFTPEQYTFSETIFTAKQLLQGRFNALLVNSFVVDRLLQEAAKKDPIKIDATTKTAVEGRFHNIIGNATFAKEEIAKDFYAEMEQIRLSGSELNLLQRMDFEMTIDLLNFGLNFVKHFEELFLKINNF